MCNSDSSANTCNKRIVSAVKNIYTIGVGVAIGIGIEFINTCSIFPHAESIPIPIATPTPIVRGKPKLRLIAVVD